MSERYPRPARVHPPLATPAYRSSALRAPTKPLVVLPHNLTEITGPLLGPERVAVADADLTAAPGGGEAQGQRIIVYGQVRDSGGRPVPYTLMETWQANAAGRYRHAAGNWAAPLDPHFTGAGATAFEEPHDE